jgi:uncharacterized surface protein with fasciclin (FAS1) repeats
VVTTTGVVTAAADAGGDVLQVVSVTPNLATLTAALNASGMTTALQAEGPITFFAPNDDAFAALPPEQLEALLADPAALVSILQYHVVIDSVNTAQLAALGAALSSDGQQITVTVQADGTLGVNNARIVGADVPAANGIIHIIDQILTPPAAAAP